MPQLGAAQGRIVPANNRYRAGEASIRFSEEQDRLRHHSAHRRGLELSTGSGPLGRGCTVCRSTQCCLAVWSIWVESSTRLGGFRSLKKTPEASYTTKVNYRKPTSRGTTRCVGIRYSSRHIQEVYLDLLSFKATLLADCLKPIYFRQGLYRFAQHDALAQPERQRLHDGPLDKRALALHLGESQALVERERGRVAAQHLERDEGHACGIRQYGWGQGES